MGFIRNIAAKVTGADIQADAVERASITQADAVRASSEAAAANAREAAAQSARQQEAATRRAAAVAESADAISKPLENPDVQLDAPSEVPASAAAKKRRQAFGVGTVSSGVNI